MKTFASDLSKGFVSCSRCGVLKSLSEVYIDKDGIVNHSCEKFEKDNMKILVGKEFLKDCLHELNHNEKYGVNNVILVIERLLKDNPEPTTKQVTPQETVEFLIEITDTLAAYLWNKKEETTTHTYAKYLDELRGKLEEYSK